MTTTSEGPPRRTDPEGHKARVRAANRARYAATQALIRENQARFDELYAQHAAPEGVTPQPSDPVRRKANQERAREAAERRAARAAARDLTGMTVGRLTVLRQGPNSEPTPSTPNGATRWWCRCACGTEKLIRRHSLVTGMTRSCGCLQRELTATLTQRTRDTEASGDAVA